MIKLNKKRANVSILVAVFCFSFIVFSAFAIDMAFVTMNRVKLQRAVETTALASIAKYKENSQDYSKKYFSLYKAEFDTLKDAQLLNVYYKEEESGEKKVKIEAQLELPTYFLRFAGLKNIKIKANSYAQTYEQIQENVNFEDIVESDSIITDKNSDEIEVITDANPDGYFIFAGIKDDNNEFIWQDIGCKANANSYKTTVGANSFYLVCSNEAKFDFSRTCSENSDINIANYIKIYSANQGECLSKGAITEQSGSNSGNFEVKILNNTKLITKDDF